MLNLFGKWFGVDLGADEYHIEVGIGLFFFFYMVIYYERVCDKPYCERGHWSKCFKWQYGEFGVIW